MRMSARMRVSQAKMFGWSAEQLLTFFPTMPLDVAQALLDGYAVVSDEDEVTGQFRVYVAVQSPTVH